MNNVYDFSLTNGHSIHAEHVTNDKNVLNVKESTKRNLVNVFSITLNYGPCLATELNRHCSSIRRQAIWKQVRSGENRRITKLIYI